MVSRLRPPIRLALVAAIAVGYGWWVTGLPAFSTSATIAVVGAGGIVAAVTLARRDPARAPEQPLDWRSGIIWGGVAVVLAAWQLASWMQEPRSTHPTLSSMANAALEPRPARAVAFGLWLAGAAWLARR